MNILFFHLKATKFKKRAFIKKNSYEKSSLC